MRRAPRLPRRKRKRSRPRPKPSLLRRRRAPPRLKPSPWPRKRRRRRADLSDRRCGEAGEIGDSEPRFDSGNLLHGLIEAVLAELPVLDRFEALGQLVESAFGERGLESG